MRYSRFEQLALAVGTLFVLAALLFSSYGQRLSGRELVAQLMLLGVLAAALHFGRRGGFVAAVCASAIYTLMSVPELVAAQGVTSADVLLVIARIAAYGLVGIIGGEACGRLRYSLSRYGLTTEYDEWSQVFNQRHAAVTLLRAIGGHERYGAQFSLVLVSMDPAVTADLGPQRTRTLVRAVANQLRNDLRMVDEVARLEDGRFFVLLPHTAREGGLVVAKRLAASVRDLVGARDESVTATCLGSVEDAIELTALADELSESATDTEDAPDQLWSGAYNSAGDSARNPADANATSAPGASTLKMSTAAAPDGSTKQ
jgi:GGDEF domain-containing protein